MTERDILLEVIAMLQHGTPPKLVTVTGGDYSYTGWLTGASKKRSGAIRANVEDENGRLFIHRADQVTLNITQHPMGGAL